MKVLIIANLTLWTLSAVASGTPYQLGTFKYSCDVTRTELSDPNEPADINHNAFFERKVGTVTRELTSANAVTIKRSEKVYRGDGNLESKLERSVHATFEKVGEEHFYVVEKVKSVRTYAATNEVIETTAEWRFRTFLNENTETTDHFNSAGVIDAQETAVITKTPNGYKILQSMTHFPTAEEGLSVVTQSCEVTKIR